MREIKFRCWLRKKIQEFELGDVFCDHKGRAIDFRDIPVMQFTGLKDKNGKEIYEGDIVKIDHWKSSGLFDYSKPFTVEWRNGQIDFTQGDYHNFIGSLNGKIYLEVIGNIYENPELMTNEQEPERSIANPMNSEQNPDKI